MNLQSMGNYSPNSSSAYSGGNFDGGHSYGQPASTYESSYDATRNSMDDHMKKQLDEQLSKVSGQLALAKSRDTVSGSSQDMGITEGTEIFYSNLVGRPLMSRLLAQQIDMYQKNGSRSSISSNSSQGTKSPIPASKTSRL